MSFSMIYVYPAVVLLATFAAALARADEPVQPPMRIVTLASGTRFALFGERPAAPAPTVLVFAAGLEDMDKQRIYTEAARQLSERGWVYASVDIPCHGIDHREGEPATLSGWAHRLKNNEDLMGSFVARGSEVLNHLIAEGHTNPDRIAACGTSRGGFCALHFAAAEPRVRGVTCISPVTNPLALSEFAGVTPKQVASVNLLDRADRLVGRSIWISIGNDDARVGTDDCITLARKIVTESRRTRPELKVAPVEIVVGPSEGHHAIDDAYSLAARFLEKRLAP